jgi:hypothetical protein
MDHYDYIKNEVDLLVSKFILMEKKKFGVSFENNRNEFYGNIEDVIKKIKDKVDVFLPWSRLYDEGMFLMYELRKLYKNQKKSQTPYYLLTNILKLLNSIKLLINNGYIQSSYIIYRTVIENFQLELIALSDITESKKILAEYDNSNEYWYKYVKSGKNNLNIEKSLKEIKFKNISLIFPERKLINELSNFVHGSTNSAFIFEPNIFNPDICFDAPFGIINFNSNTYYLELVQYLLENIYANLELILNRKTWITRSKKWGDDMINLLINYNVLSLSFSYYFEQYKNKSELWELDEFFELIEMDEGKNVKKNTAHKRGRSEPS